LHNPKLQQINGLGLKGFNQLKVKEKNTEREQEESRDLKKKRTD